MPSTALREGLLDERGRIGMVWEDGVPEGD